MFILKLADNRVFRLCSQIGIFCEVLYLCTTYCI